MRKTFTRSVIVALCLTFAFIGYGERNIGIATGPAPSFWAEIICPESVITNGEDLTVRFEYGIYDYGGPRKEYDGTKTYFEISLKFFIVLEKYDSGKYSETAQVLFKEETAECGESWLGRRSEDITIDKELLSEGRGCIHIVLLADSDGFACAPRLTTSIGNELVECDYFPNASIQYLKEGEDITLFGRYNGSDANTNKGSGCSAWFW